MNTKLETVKKMLGEKFAKIDDIMVDVCDGGMSDAEIKKNWGISSLQLRELKKLIL